MNENDKKILAYIYHNSRDPATKIAKELKLTREQVSYKISKFEKEGIIKGYIPLINYSKLGYKNMILFLVKCNKQAQIEKIKQNLKQDKNRINTVEILSKFDLGFLFIFKEEIERNNYISNLILKYNKEIKNYKIIEPYFSEYYPLKFLGHNDSNPKTFHEFLKNTYELDEKEKKILKILNKNANENILKIAEKTKISPELVLYKLKKLKKEEVIISTRAHFDMQKIGYYYTIIFLEFPNLSEENQDKLRRFARENKNIDSLMFIFGKTNAYLQLFYKEVNELQNILGKLKKEFSEDSIDIEIINLKNEGEEVNTLPFL